ncbi:MAG: excinuclease ABC subunit UvrA [Flavobacteriales bacterium]|nr:excinuclease ABC subunit UvrA [Flavobacteriales bacterium]
MPQAVSTSSTIEIRGARQHNLKGVDVDLPHGKLTVITGLSGSGKSSLAFDTLYVEGRRRYIESLSAYVRQFAGKLEKPLVDRIDNLSPAIALEQRVSSRSSRSTVGTATEIYDHFKMLFARIGDTISPVSGETVKRHSTRDVLACVENWGPGARFYVCAPVCLPEGRTLKTQLEVWQQQGLVRLWRGGATEVEGGAADVEIEAAGGETMRIDDLLERSEKALKEMDTEGLMLVLDRLARPEGKVIEGEEKNEGENFWGRLGDSVETAFFEGAGSCTLVEHQSSTHHSFNARFELDGLTFIEPTPNLFSFNNPAGACPKCEGFGQVIGISESLVVPQQSKSVYDGAIAPWRGEKVQRWKNKLIECAHEFDFPVHTPYNELSDGQKLLIWEGNKWFRGVNSFFAKLEAKGYKIQNRVMLSRFRGRTPCRDCNGTRLRQEVKYVQIAGRSLPELVQMPLDTLASTMTEVRQGLGETQTAVAGRLLDEIDFRLQYLLDVGLSYLTLGRASSTLSGGESQRIQLSTSLGSSLVGSTYVLDEPSIGLHPLDTDRLIGVLRGLVNLGNTVVVVEHEEGIIRAADCIVDMGPLAGSQGGQVVFAGDFESLLAASGSLTSDYLLGRKRITPPTTRRPGCGTIKVEGVRAHNLQNVTADFLLGGLNAVTGVSGSGKSTLVSEVLLPHLQALLNQHGKKPMASDGLSGDVHFIKAVEWVDQNPIGKSSRSNPATYVKAFDEVRKIFSKQNTARVRGYKPAMFSFNTKGGRCENCEGEGQVTVGMQFMADVTLQCEMCGGRRFSDEVLEVQYKGCSIHDVLEMTVADAVQFFNEERVLVRRLEPLLDVGLGYVRMGQPSSTLSGGEAQRIKLASFLSRSGRKEHTLFIFDEPTTGLHFHDVAVLLKAFDELIACGHTVLCVEHNLDVIALADHVIDLGPGGGVHGGRVVAQGTPEQIVANAQSVTGTFLKDKLS